MQLFAAGRWRRQKRLELELDGKGDAERTDVGIVEVSEPVVKINPEELKNILDAVPNFNVGCAGKISRGLGVLSSAGDIRDQVTVGLAQAPEYDIGCAHEPPLKTVEERYAV